MILIFNTNSDEKAINSFDKDVCPSIVRDRKFETIRVKDNQLNEYINNPSLMKKFSHLLLTGSAFSASQGSKYDSQIISIIRYFVDMNKAILGICHGHQMIARTIIGDKGCRRAINPELSWKKIDIKKNELFNGIENPTFLESHYDEVCNLSDDFTIIGKNKNCEVQAFQYKDRPIWGVQFHPEMHFENGNEMIDSHLKENPQDLPFYENELENRELITQNQLVFENFFNSN